MHVLGRRWRDGYLDYHRPPGELRIQVRAWFVLQSLTDVFVDQPRNWRRLYHYVREFGPREVYRKVRSRLAETLRDRKYLCAGWGEVLEADADAPLAAGQVVAFIAPCHPECVERVVLPPWLVRPGDAADSAPRSASGGIHLYTSSAPALPPAADALAGWSRFAGTRPEAEARELLDWFLHTQDKLAAAAPRLLPLTGTTAVREYACSAAAVSGRLNAVLFGLGNYAKTCILPNIAEGIQVGCIHEIDPTQLGHERPDELAWDTSETPRDKERYDVFFVAGYHHTHVDLASAALREGGWAVVEKPLAASRAEYERLRPALSEHPGRLFVGFNMRYSRLWTYAREDLKLQPGQPVNYHCIVFEIPLGRRHWYNWPTSRSRIVSNGCHWLDHFLFMNEYAEVARYDLWKAGNGNLHVSVELANGAALSMALTDHGSRRIGVQDHIQLRAGGVTVHVENGSRYMAEDRYRILRRRRVNRLESLANMYRAITAQIVAGEPGDSQASIERTTELVLALDELACTTT